MARTIKEIAESIKREFVRNSVFRLLYGLDEFKSFDEQFSAVSIEAVIINIVATAIALLENLFDFHKQEIDKAILEERYGYAGWYVKMAKAFQKGYPINQLEEKTYYNTIDTEAQIIKFAYCEPRSSGVGVLVKIAKQENEQPKMLEPAELNAFTAYINRIKPAGVPVEVVNAPSDELNVKISVRYNPLLFADENAINDAVKAGIEDYLKGLEFNGSFIAMKMIDTLQAVNGIEIAQIDYLEIEHSKKDITGDLSYTPYSGHIVLGNLEVNKNNS